MANITVTMSVNKTVADIDDILTYTIILNNTGNTIDRNIILIDPSPVGTEFIKGTVKINGTVNTGKDLSTSCNLGSIQVGGTIKVEFNVQVKSLVDTISNSTYVDYRCKNLSKNIKSNSVTTQIKNVTIVISQTVDKTIATISDILSYNIVVTNKGNVDASNVQFTDNIPKCTSIVADSVSVDGINSPISNELKDIKLGTINIGMSKTISFKLKVNSMPNSNPIQNECFSTYEYTSVDLISKTSDSSFTDTYINFANLNVIEERNKNTEYVTGSIKYNIKYTVYVINTGNVTAQDVNFKTKIHGADFQDDSMGLNGTIKNTLNPLTGFSIDNIEPGETFVVEFKATVNSVPADSFVSSESTVLGNFLIEPTNAVVQKSFISNLVSTKVGGASLPLISSDKPSVKLGDELTYEITVANTSGMNYANVIVNDVLPSELSFVSGSIIIDTTSEPDLNLNNGIDLGGITDGTSKKVSFKVKVIEEPIDDIIYNNATVKYSYEENVIAYTVGTETIPTYVFKPKLTIKAALSDEYVYDGDIINCFVIIKNTGNLIARNVVLNDTLSNHLTFIPNSIIINSTTYALTDITTGINIGNVGIGDTVRVAFSAKVNGGDEVNNINNRVSVKGEFTIPFNPSQDETFYSNIAIAKLGNPIVITGFVDKKYAELNSVITYTIMLQNISQNEISNISFISTLTFNVSFIPNSLFIDDVLQPGVDPTSIVNIGTMMPAEIKTIVFKVVVTNLLNGETNNIPSVNYVAQNFEATIYGDPIISILRSGDIIIEQHANKNIVGLNEELLYNVRLENIGNISSENLIFTSKLLSNVQFVLGSFVIGNRNIVGEDLINGVKLGTMLPGDVINLSFRVKVISDDPSIIEGQSAIEYTFILNPEDNNSIISKTAYSNITFANIKGRELILVKTSNKGIANPGGIIKFKVIIKNNRNMTAYNVLFVDVLANNLELVLNSFKLNSVVIYNVDMNKGVEIGDIPSLAYVTVEFEVKVKYSIRPPRICNIAYALVNYKDLPKAISIISNTCRVIIGPIKFCKFNKVIVPYLP